MTDWGDKPEGDISKFNPAQHKMNRINELSRIINEAKLSLSSWNVEFNDWSYNVYFNCLVALYREVFVKFSEDDKKECEDLRIPIKNLKLKYPIQEKTKNNKWLPINPERFEIFIRWIGLYEEKIRKLQDEHGLDTPNLEDNEGL